MSKVNQIQQALLERSGDEFQKLADAYLAEKGIGYINSIGSVAGANKVRTGTPDTLITTPQGTYVFAEHTTQQLSLLSKMMDDLDKCFDESKTGVPIDRIEAVVFCFTGKLTAAEHNKLIETCQSKGVKLGLFSIDEIAFDLYRKFPALARDFLGVSIDTGQIESPERFVSLYNSNKLATPLDLSFHFREEELRHLLDALADVNLVVLSGRAGVGKSRLALEACREFREIHPEYEAFCVYGRNRDLWEDLQARFSKPGHFLILVDDANRVSQFEYVVDLLQHQRDDQQIKVLATVRDYAAVKVRDEARSIGGGVEIELASFSDEQIKELITNEYEIVNFHYLERIVGISHGNPRLAVMAAEVAKEESLSSIHDVSSLYDRYFSSIREDLNSEGADPGSADLLQVAAIVSFFKAVDRTNEDMMNAIKQVVGISVADFWETVDRLHGMELLDMYENDVARVSDQVLGTYLFYLAVFKEGVLNFGVLLSYFFPKLQHRIIDSINPILNAFDSEKIVAEMRQYVKNVWTGLQEKGDEKQLLSLIDVFWFTMPTDALVWCRGQIDNLDLQPQDIASITFNQSSVAVPSPSILSVLKQFAFVDLEEAQMAISLLISYLAKRPMDTPIVLRILIENYGFKPDSYAREFEIQCAVIDNLWSRLQGGGALLPRVFLAVASNYLNTQFDNYEMKDSQSILVRRFNLPSTPFLANLRESIWQRLFGLYNSGDFQSDVLTVIQQYSQASCLVINSEIVRADAKYLLPFLESSLNPSRYLHCTIMHDYLDFLENHDGSVPDSLREKFRNNTYDLAEIILPEWREKRELDMSWQTYEQFKRSRVGKYTLQYTFDDYLCFFEYCIEIRDVQRSGGGEHQIQEGAQSALLELADRDSDLYVRVLAMYLERQDLLRLNGWPLVQKLMEKKGREITLQLLIRIEFPTKTRWLFNVHEVISAHDVDLEMLTHLYDLYRSADENDLPSVLDFLLKYYPLDARVVANVVSIILKKAEEKSSFTYALKMLFNTYTEVAKRLPVLFVNDLELLKHAYLVKEGASDHSDYNGKVFDQLLDLDPNFITEYVDWKYSKTQNGRLSYYDDQRDYAFIWARPDYQSIMDRVVGCIYSHEKKSYVSINPYLKAFFSTKDDESNIEAQVRQDAYLLRLIDERNADADFMIYLFGLISNLSPERRFDCIKLFVQRNGNFEAFTRLPLEPGILSWTGSKIPVLQGHLNYWKSLLTIMTTVDLLSHRQYVERCIRELLVQIEQEKKRDFIRD